MMFNGEKLRYDEKRGINRVGNTRFVNIPGVDGNVFGDGREHDLCRISRKTWEVERDRFVRGGSLWGG